MEIDNGSTSRRSQVKCGRCESSHVRSLGSGSRKRTIYGGIFQLVRYKCRECEHIWQQAPLHSAYKFQPASKGHMCTQCGCNFNRRGALLRHIERLHQPEGVVFTCAICSDGFKTRNNRDDHQRWCTRDGSSIRCRACRNTFSSKHKWLVHRAETSHNECHLVRVQQPARGMPKPELAYGVVELLGEAETPPELEATLLCVAVETAQVPLEATVVPLELSSPTAPPAVPLELSSPTAPPAVPLELSSPTAPPAVPAPSESHCSPLPIGLCDSVTPSDSVTAARPPPAELLGISVAELAQEFLL